MGRRPGTDTTGLRVPRFVDVVPHNLALWRWQPTIESMAALPPTLERLIDVLDSRPDVTAAYLFGSTVTSGTEPGDIDVAVTFDPDADLPALLALQVELETRVGVPVDLHDFDRLPVDLQFRVVQEGVVLVDRHPPTRRRREIKVLNAYNDFKPYLDRLRAATRGRLAATAQQHG